MAKIPIKITRMTGLSGNKEWTSVKGDTKDAGKIATAMLDVVQRFTEAVIKEDIETAYGLCANEFRSGTSVQQFVNRLEQANNEYGGKPLEFRFHTITWVYADEPARQESNKEGDWPKETPKPNKRAIGFGWFTDNKTPEGESGRYICFWVTEEAEGYCVAKFEQYHM
jgi:hypothetical protein